MKLLKLHYKINIILFFIGITTVSYAQLGEVVVHEDAKISELLQLKKEINLNNDSKSRYRIQIYSGNRSAAERIMAEFRNSFYWSTKLVYETPNYKVWVGNFRTRLEADRALQKVKTKYPNAFKFIPKK